MNTSEKSPDQLAAERFVRLESHLRITGTMLVAHLVIDAAAKLGLELDVGMLNSMKKHLIVNPAAPVAGSREQRYSLYDYAEIVRTLVFNRDVQRETWREVAEELKRGKLKILSNRQEAFFALPEGQLALVVLAELVKMPLGE